MNSITPDLTTEGVDPTNIIKNITNKQHNEYATDLFIFKNLSQFNNIFVSNEKWNPETAKK